VSPPAVEDTLRAINANLPVRTVHAHRSKQLRAEPVVALYEQGRVHHVGVLPELEEQCCTWVPGVGRSPDRVDSLVYASTDLAESRARRKRRMTTLSRSENKARALRAPRKADPTVVSTVPGR
jgi:phage terminase large subunit-like protein